MLTLKAKMFEESKKSRAPSNIILQLLIFGAVFFVIALAEGLPSTIIASPKITAELIAEDYQSLPLDEQIELSTEITTKVMSDWTVSVPSLYFTVFGTILAFVYCRFIEQRSAGSMGIRRSKAVKHYLTGMAVGALLMSVITVLGLLAGAMKISIVNNFSIGIILLSFGGWLVQGMSEEFICRGYLMNSVGGKHSPVLALTISSLIFACLHLANDGINLLAFFNLALFGAFAGLYMICFDDIWGACAIHSVWNFTQGNIYGISVSGTGNSESFLRTSAASSNIYLTGGTFGIEGSIFTTIVLLAGSAVILFMINKKNKSSCE